MIIFTPNTVIKSADVNLNFESVADISNWSNPYKFSAYRGTSWTAATNTWGKVVFDIEEYDTNNNFTSGTYTCPVAGYYQINTAVGSLNSHGASPGVAIYKNGGIYKQGHRHVSIANATGTAQYIFSTVSSLVSASASDTIEVYYYGNAGPGAYASYETWFNGFLASAT